MADGSTASASAFRKSNDDVFIPSNGRKVTKIQGIPIQPPDFAGDAFGEDSTDAFDAVMPNSGFQQTLGTPSSSTDQTPSSQDSGGEKAKRNLFVSGLPTSVADGEFRQLFEPYGEVLSTKVMLNIKTGVSRGFGFVLFTKEDDAAKAVKAMHGNTVKGQKLKVTYSEHRGENLLVASNKLYVRNVPSAHQLNREQLLSYFQRFGKIVSIQARADPYHQNGGALQVPFPSQIPQQDHMSNGALDIQLVPIGPGGQGALRVLAIEYETCESAKQCVDATHHSMPFLSCTTPLLAKIFEPQELRVKRLKEHHALTSKKKPNGKNGNGSSQNGSGGASGGETSSHSPAPLSRAPPVPSFPTPPMVPPYAMYPPYSYPMPHQHHHQALPPPGVPPGMYMPPPTMPYAAPPMPYGAQPLPYAPNAHHHMRAPMQHSRHHHRGYF